jgi:hypothetical protein
MAPLTRRQFVEQTALASAALYGHPMRMLGRELQPSDDKKEAPLDASRVQKLASAITGRVITPEAPDYDSSRLVNNRAYDRHPALIVRCASAVDVVRTLDFAQGQSLPLAVRAGGHSAAGFGVCNSGVVIDLSGMRRVEVDVDRRVACAEAGSVVRDLDESTQRFGLATPMGTCPTVGIAGLTLGGGEGTLMPKYGAACDNLLSAHMVTVDGRQVEASQESDASLFWGIRGGGGNFGVATAFEYRLYPVSEVLAGALIYPAGRIPELLETYVKFTRTAPDEMSGTCLVLPSDQGPRLLILVSYCGQANAGNVLLRPLRAQLKPQVDTVKAMSHLEAQQKWFPAAAKPDGYFVANLFLPQLNETAIAAITSATENAPPKFRVLIVHFHGAVIRVRSSDMAFPLRQPGYEVDISGNWSAPEEELSAVRWVNALCDKLKPLSHGLYVNGLSETNDKLVRSAYGPNYTRLAELKRKYDPRNVLRLNQNIKPS